MKQNKLNIKSLWALLLIAVFALGFTACSDKDSAGGTPEITGVRILTTDTINYSYDQYYTKAGAGTMLAIMGNNLGKALKVYVNDQEVSFNSTMNTDHSIIITVPTEDKGFKLSTFDSSIPDEIRVETSNGVATYAFKITAPGPQLQRISALYPRNAGDTLSLYGMNLVDIEKIFITDVMSAALDTTKWEADAVPGNHVDVTKYFDIVQNHALNSTTQSYQTTSVVGAIVPEAVPDSGTLVVQCAAGTTYLPFYKRPGKPVVLYVSTDMPEIGEELIITGREFVQMESISYGDVTLSSDEFWVSESEDTIYVPFKQIPSDAVSTLTIAGPGGSVSIPNFYDKSTILTTFDGDATDNGWSPNARYEDSGTADGKYAYLKVKKEYQQWWGTMVYFRKDWDGNMFSFSNNIPATATADHIYLAFECYDAGDYNNGQFFGYLRFMIQPKDDSENQYDNFTFDADGADYNAGIGVFPDGPVLQDINGDYHKNKWYRTVVPLEKFACYKGKTMAEIKNIGLNQFRIQDINQSTLAGKIDLKIDNVRVIYIP